MSHQINLLDPSLRRDRTTLDSRAGLLALAATMVTSIGFVLALKSMSSTGAVRAAAAEHELVALQARIANAGPSASAVSSTVAELARLRASDAAQQRLRVALESGQVGASQGYSPYLLALSRQTAGSLWLTAFSVAPDGRSLDMAGRMTDPHQLAGYLKRLNAEPLFKGREFAQLSLKALDPDPESAAPHGSASTQVEFALRSVGNGSELR